jgi:hypothetical protein
MFLTHSHPKFHDCFTRLTSVVHKIKIIFEIQFALCCEKRYAIRGAILMRLVQL